MKSVVLPAGDFTGDNGLHIELPSPLEGLSGLGGGVSMLFFCNSFILEATNLPCGGDCLNLCVGVLFSLLSELELFIFSMCPLDVILLLELELAVLPVLLLRPLTLYLENGSAVLMALLVESAPALFKKASLAALVFSAWFEFVDAKLSEDLCKLSDDLFKFVLQ